MLMRTAGRERFASVGPVGEEEGEVARRGNRSILRSLHKTGGRGPQTVSPSSSSHPSNGGMSWYLQPSRMAHPRALVPEGCCLC